MTETEVLLNANVGAVVFVMDYLQIQLDVGTITYMQFPDVVFSDKVSTYGERDYRNTICEFIGESVSSVDYSENEVFSLNFRSGKISISLSAEKYTCPEMVVIDLPDKSISF